MSQKPICDVHPLQISILRTKINDISVTAYDRVFTFEIMSRQGKVGPERTIKSFCSALKDCAAGFGTVKALWKQNVGDCVY